MDFFPVNLFRFSQPNLNLICTGLTVFLLSGCSHSYYNPNLQNVPVFEHRNQAFLSGSVSGDLETTTRDFQLAFSVIDHIAFSANYMSFKESYWDHNYSRGNSLEGAIGYYWPDTVGGHFQVFAGYGSGSQDHEYYKYVDFFYLFRNEYQGAASFTIEKLYLQPSWGIDLKWFELTASTRLNILNFHDIWLKGKIRNSKHLYYRELISLSQRYFYTIEPCIAIRGGFKLIKIQYQVMYIQHLNSSQLQVYFPFHHGIGIYLGI